MKEERIKWLISQYLDQNLNEEETLELEECTRSHPGVAGIMERLSNEAALGEDLRQWASFRPDPQRLQEDIRALEARHRCRRVIRGWFLAASIAGLGLLVWSGMISPNRVTDHPPGGNHAWLTLSGGRRISLDSSISGTIAEENGGKLIKIDSTTLRYTASSESTPEAYHEINTPRGGQFCLILPDETRIWINSSSTIRFPNRFAGKHRVINLKGEAYFEVTHNCQIPLHVLTDHMLVDVLGTRFVVSDYADDPLNHTTLVEGKVLASSHRSRQILAPGDQLVVSDNHADNEEKTQVLHNVDTDEAMAWKEGYFHFAHTPLRRILRQLSRWYDLDIDIASSVPEHIYNGEVDRRLPVSTLIEFLERKDMRLRLDGKKLFVTTSTK